MILFTNHFFQGWTEENLVANIEEWGHKGRVIWVNKMDSKSHVTRTLEILEIINNDLGFANVELQQGSIVSDCFNIVVISLRFQICLGLFGYFS